MRLFSAAAVGFLVALTGCHSRYIAANVTNQTGGPLSPVEVDYPSASFGTESLAAGATYSYRFKIIGNGPTAVLWTDSAHNDHKSSGPALHEGDEGSLTVTVGPGSAAAWELKLVHHGSGD